MADVAVLVFRLECEIQADLKPVTVKWTHKGQELQSSEKYQEVFVEEQGIAKLTVKDFVPEDEGEYSCVVSGEVIEPETGMLRRARTISTTAIVEMTESIPEMEEEKPTTKTVEETAPVLETPTVQIAKLLFTKPLQAALQPNEERVLE